MRVIRAAARVPSLTGHSILQNAHGATDPRRGAPDFEGWRAEEGCRWGVAVGERGDRGCGGGKADVAVLAVNWLLPFLFFSQFKLLHYNRKTVVRSPRLSGSIRNQPFLISIQGTRKLVVN